MAVQPQTQTLTYRCPHCQQAVEVEPRAGEEMMVCPNEACRKPFRVEVPAAQPAQPVEQSAPGLILPNGNGTAQQAPQPPPAPTAVQPAPAPEQEVLRVQPVMFRRYPFRCLAYALLALAGLASLVVAAFSESPVFWAVIGLGAAGVAFFRFIPWFMRMRNTFLIVTTKRCVIEVGVINKQVTEIPMTDISDIILHQTYVHKLLDVGDITLVSKSGETKRVVLMAVPNPKQVAEQIQSHR